MRKNIFIAIAALAGFSWLLTTPGPALGQGHTRAGASLAEMIEGARWRLGAMRINAAFSLSNVGYDSDVFYGFLAEPLPDYTLSAGVSIQVLLPLSKKVVIELSDSPQYIFYLETKGERAWNNSFGGQVHFAYDRVYVQLGGGLSNVRYRLSPELNINVRQKQDSLGGLVLWQVSKGASLAFVYGGAKYDLGEAEFGGTNIAEALNRKEDYFDFITYIQPTTRVRFFVDGQYGTYVFTQMTSSFRDARSYGLFGGVEFIPRVGEALQKVGVRGSVRLGYQRLDFIDSQFVNGSGFTGAADVSVSFMKKNSVRASFSRGFQPSVFSGSSYYLSTTYGGGISRLLSRKASFSYDLSFGRSLYPGSEAPDSVLNHYTNHSFGLDVRLARQLSIGFLGTLGKRMLDSSELVRNRNFFGFYLVYGSTGVTMSTPGGGLRR